MKAKNKTKIIINAAKNTKSANLGALKIEKNVMKIYYTYKKKFTIISIAPLISLFYFGFQANNFGLLIISTLCEKKTFKALQVPYIFSYKIKELSPLD